MPMCCGKDRETNFCPVCGKPMDAKAGLRGLLDFISRQLKTAELLATRKEASYQRARGEAVYKVIDGE